MVSIHDLEGKERAMDHPGFFANAGPFTLAQLAELAGATLSSGAEGPDHSAREIVGVRALDEAGPADIAFLDNRKYVSQLEASSACAVYVAPELTERVPAHTIAVVTPQPYRAFALALATFYPEAMMPRGCTVETPRHHGGGTVDASAELEEDVILEPGAVVGAGAQIGKGTRIGANAMVGDRCTVGRDAWIGASASLVCALLGDRVYLHNGARIGQDGFGFAMGPQGHLKVPQIGRVIIQDDVDIGANTSIDRGALKDTIIGEGTKIDNLVQIGHNVIVGRHCVIVANTAIAGSTVIDDFVAIGGSAAIAGHLHIGMGTQIAAMSGVHTNIPPGSRYGGIPAIPMGDWARQVAMIKRMTRKPRK